MFPTLLPKIQPDQTGTPRPRPPRWPLVLLLVLLAGSLIFNHGCHGADVDDELCGRGLVIRALFR